jgi:hypothetical protein
MSMPKGHKVKGGYATVSNDIGSGYREIAEKMTDAGYRMNHSTARNVFLAAMKKFARDICNLYEVDVSQERLDDIAADPRFQSSVCGMISDIR